MTTSFIEDSHYVQSILTTEQIRELWNETGLWKKKPANESTIRRWLNQGPETKNPRFEPWVSVLAKVLRIARGSKEVSSLSTDEKIAALLKQSSELTQRDLATVESIAVYGKRVSLSRKQKQIVEKLYIRVFGV